MAAPGAAVGALGVAAALVAGACGGDADTTVDTSAAPPESTTTAVAPTDPPSVDTDPDSDPPVAEPLRVESADGSAVLEIPAGALPAGFDPADLSVEWSAGEMYHEEIETFRSGFVEALRTGDVDWLVGRLHPDVMTLYGEAACRDYLPTVVDAGVEMTVDSAGEAGPWRWELDGASREYAAAVPLATTFTSRDQTLEQEMHVLSIGGRFHWWTDCGDPLADGLAGGERLASETVATVRLEPSGLTLSEPARLEWHLPRHEGMLLGFHVSGDALETVDLDLVIDESQEATAAAMVEHFSDLQTFLIYGTDLVVTSSDPPEVSRDVGESFYVENSIRLRTVSNRSATVYVFFDSSGFGDVLLGQLYTEGPPDPDALRSPRVALDYRITPIAGSWTVKDREWEGDRKEGSPVLTPWIAYWSPKRDARDEPETHEFEEPDVARGGPFTCVAAGNTGDVDYSAKFTLRVDVVPAFDPPAGVEVPSLRAHEYDANAGYDTPVECLDPAPTTTAGTTTTAPTTTVSPGTGAGTGVDHPPFEPGNEDTGGASAAIACGRILGVGAGATVTIAVTGGGSSDTHTGLTDADGAFRIPFPIDYYDVISWSVVEVTASDGTPIDTPELGGELNVDGPDDVECVVDG